MILIFEQAEEDKEASEAMKKAGEAVRAGMKGAEADASSTPGKICSSFLFGRACARIDDVIIFLWFIEPMFLPPQPGC